MVEIEDVPSDVPENDLSNDPGFREQFFLNSMSINAKLSRQLRENKEEPSVIRLDERRTTLSNGSELIPKNKATVPSQPDPVIKAKVAQILMRCFGAPVADPTNCGIPEDKFYLGWSATTLLGASTSVQTPWISFGSSQFRILDGYLCHKGYENASLENQRELHDCLNYLNAMWAIQTLAELKRASSEEDQPLIIEAETQVQDLASKKYSTFAKYVADEIKLAAKLGYSRDVIMSGISTLHVGNTIAATFLKDVPQTQLSGSAKEFLGVVPFLGPSLGILSGFSSSIQGILEANSASDLEEALLEAQRLEQEVFASSDYGDANIQKLLLNLIWHRQQRRDLELLKAKLLKYNGTFRTTNGVIGIGASATAIGLFAAGGAAVFSAATLGISAIVGGVAGGLFLLWANISSTIAQHVQKSYDKVWRSINAKNQGGPQNISKLPTDSSRQSIQEISNAFAQKIADQETRSKTIELLVALGIPRLIAETAGADGGKRLADHLIPPRGIPMSNEDALRKVYLGPGTAQGKLLAVQEWLADPVLQKTDLEQIAKRTNENTLAWSKYLAPGENMGDICKSRLTLKRIEAHWGDDTFRKFMKASLNTESVVNAGDAWRLLQSQREETKTQEKASATVAAWINGMKVDSILNCLESPKTDALTLEYKKVLESFGIGTDYKDIDGIKKALRAHVSTTDLNVNTIGNFMAVYKETSENDKVPLRRKMKDFWLTTVDNMHKDEQKEFMQMLGVNDGVSGPSEAEQMDAMLGKIHKFLLVSEKLQGQTLTKVIASLHEYPTDGSIPKDIARIAAIRELRARCSTADQTDVGHTLALAKELSSGQLHERTFGAGEGGACLALVATA
ncbi:hypothetical protein RAE21_12050 [Rhodoferax sp. TBRC 17198]|uniref:hypothetical protein n=1 Tax=Rhodoferax potami TaxID=3068338 RepID=UPI0028BF2216|nr:hypothetical protein [Rhodoferax sp. TBRC 17198]MDT7523133.1 hypothetical protein [Rhodoferax sp. TBRC 17198]